MQLHKPFPQIVFDTAEFVDLVMDGFKNKSWIHYASAPAGDLFADPPPSLMRNFKTKIWESSYITWIHSDGFISIHKHNGETVSDDLKAVPDYVEDRDINVYKMRATPSNLPGDKFRDKSCALIIPIFGMGTKPTKYYDEDKNWVEDIYTSVPTLFRVNQWHNVDNSGGANRLMMMLNFYEPLEFESVIQLIEENLA